jgi:hypothetical protein
MQRIIAKLIHCAVSSLEKMKPDASDRSLMLLPITTKVCNSAQQFIYVLFKHWFFSLVTVNYTENQTVSKLLGSMTQFCPSGSLPSNVVHIKSGRYRV